MFRIQWLLSGVTCLALIASHVPGATAQASDSILWLDAEHTRPYVIPESAFDKIDWSFPENADLSSLPFTDQQADRLRSMVAAKATRLANDPCRPYPEGVVDDFGIGPRPGTKTMLELVQEASRAVVGQVLRLVPAWNPTLRTPSTLVVLRLNEVLVGDDSALRVGHDFSFLMSYGRISFGGVEDCLLPIEGYFPEVGDRVLVLGWPDPINRGNLIGTTRFPIRNGVIDPGNHRALRDRTAVPWLELRKEFDAVADKQE